MAISNRRLKHRSEPETDSGAATEPIVRLNAKTQTKGAAPPEQAWDGRGRSNQIEGGEPEEPIAAPSAFETKLATVLDMRVGGRSQAQIAMHFDVTERTVRRWEQEAKRRGITPLRDRDPFEYARESLDDLAEYRADALARYRAARDVDDHNSMSKWLKALSHIRQERDRVLEICRHTGVPPKAGPWST